MGNTITMSATAPSAAALVESAKRAAAIQAVEEHLLPSHRYVGIGSGSTVVYVVEAIVAKGADFFKNMVFIPTGSQSKGLIRTAGLTLEKLVAIAAKTFVAVADYRKQSPRLCTTWKNIPIEVLPLSAPDVLLRLQALGSPAPAVRSGLPSKAGECVTDNGMWIIDAPFPPLLLPSDLTPEVDGLGKGGLWEVSKLAEELLRTPGIVEIGLFHGFNGTQAVGLGKEGQAQKPVAAYFGTVDGKVDVQRA